MAAVVALGAARFEPGLASDIADRSGCAGANLEQGQTAGREQAGDIAQQRAIGIEPVEPAVERQRRIVVAHLGVDGHLVSGMLLPKCVRRAAKIAWP